MEALEPLFDRKIECVFCKGQYTTKKIRSKFIKVADYDTDFCPKYVSEELNALLYNIHVCPYCGYSASDDFSKYFAPNTKEAIEINVKSSWVPHDFSKERTINDAIKTYKLAAYCASLKKEKHITIAGLYLRIAWLYRLTNNREQENRFLKLSSEEYKFSYSTDDFKGTQVSETRLLYLVGELSRRYGDIDQATKYFSKVIENQSRAMETKIIEMTRERWQEIRENQKAAL